jgi:hypothetical protein
MSSTRPTHKRLYATLLCVLPLFACEPNEGLPDRVPTFLDVVSTADGLRTGYRPDNDTSDWRFFRHDDLFDDNACGDMAIAPDGIMRNLALLRRAEDGSWSLRIRTGLGPANWSSDLATIAVPNIVGQNNIPASACQRLRIKHLRDQSFGIVWIANGVLNNAVFTAGEPIDSAVALGPASPMTGAGNISASSGPLVGFNDNAVFVFPNAERTRIHTTTGTVSQGGINFIAGATTDFAHEALSDVVVRDSAMFLAALQGDTLRLLRATGAADWQVISSCPTTANGIRGRLLFADPAGDFWVAESIGTGVSRLKNFNGCAARNLVLPILTGNLSYHPGTE